jgi:hypothetical protein
MPDNTITSRGQRLFYKFFETQEDKQQATSDSTSTHDAHFHESFQQASSLISLTNYYYYYYEQQQKSNKTIIIITSTMTTTAATPSSTASVVNDQTQDIPIFLRSK